MVDRWSLEDTTALAFDPWGRLLAAAGEGIFVVEPGSTRPLGVLGRFASASALSPTATGKIYVLDRKGDRIGVLEPGAKAPAPLREERGTRFAALTEVRGRLVGAAQREGRLLEIAASGLETPLASLPVDGIDSVCVDAASRFVVLEARRGRIVLSTDDGTVVDRLDLKAKGLEKPTRVVCGSDGTLDVYDASTGQVWRIGE